MDLVLIILFFLIILQLFTTYKLCKYKYVMDYKNSQLIQFYLDMKFVHKLVVDSVSIKKLDKFIDIFVNNIKEYYNLDDVAIIYSTDPIRINNNILFSGKITKYIEDNIDQIHNDLKDKNLLKKRIFEEYVVYFFTLKYYCSDKLKNGLIVCVEKLPSLLNDNEIASLENAVNLLKTRIVYK